MEKRDARLFQHEIDIDEQAWNMVELESRRQLRYRIHELIQLATSSSITTSEMRQHLRLGVAQFGQRFARQLVRSLHCNDFHERQSIVWLLTLLNEQETIPLLQRMSANERLGRPVRLSASLALAGMGATKEMTDSSRRPGLYAIR
jgi:hypothetical protein